MHKQHHLEPVERNITSFYHDRTDIWDEPQLQHTTHSMSVYLVIGAKCFCNYNAPFFSAWTQLVGPAFMNVPLPWTNIAQELLSSLNQDSSRIQSRIPIVWTKSLSIDQILWHKTIHRQQAFQALLLLIAPSEPMLRGNGGVERVQCLECGNQPQRCWLWYWSKKSNVLPEDLAPTV